MLGFLLLCLASASSSAAIPLDVLQSVLRSPLPPASAPAVSRPSYFDNLFQQTRESESPTTCVGISFNSSSSLDISSQYFEFPLGERISPPVDLPLLPLHLTHARIVNATVRTGGEERPLGPDRLQSVICLAYPVAEDEKVDVRQADTSFSETDKLYPVWWSARDGEVDFGDRLSRWYLGGRQVESYECI